MEPIRKATAVVLRGSGASTEVLVFDHPLDEGGLMVQLPAGTVEPGEAPAAAAVRELREETGVVASEPVLAAILDEEVDGVMRVRWVYVFTAPPGLRDEWPYSCDCGAPITVHWIPLRDAAITEAQQPWIEAARHHLRSRGAS